LAQLNISLLGTCRLTLRRDGYTALAPSCRDLLAYLVLRRDRSHARDVVATAFWGDSPEPLARRRLNTTLWRLRQTIEPRGVPRGTFLVAGSTGELGFNTASEYWLDVDEFEKAVTTVMQVPIESRGQEDLNRLERAIDLYRGELLEGVYADWVLEHRVRLTNLYLAALGCLGSTYRARGEFVRSIAFTELLVRHEPLREDVHRELMSAYAEAGRRAEALRQYDRCRRTLLRELDIEPMPETVHLASLIERGEQPVVAATLELTDVLEELTRARRETTRLGQSIDRSLQLLRDQLAR
jgi:DNA-binding SARP family transcriptional activator